jgi:hypothetical protein
MQFATGVIPCSKGTAQFCADWGSFCMIKMTASRASRCQALGSQQERMRAQRDDAEAKPQPSPN